MQRREFKDAMQEMSDHTVAKIQEHVQLLTRLDLEQNGELLDFGGVEMDINHPRTVLYAILKRVVIDFKPTNDTYSGVMNKVLKTLKVDDQKNKEK
tara:strand:+ start:36 stop:323 length:288 start_codon:yes stop_codon:yes gene_type:complete